MFKQIFNNLFNPKEAKFGFNLDFVGGTLNHNPIVKIQKGKCKLNFEKQTLIISQDEQSIIDYMVDVESIRTWQFKGNIYFAIKTKTYNEYMFSFGSVDLWLKSIQRYAQAFNIPFKDCGESEYDETTEDDE